MTLSEFRRALNEVVTTPGKKGDSNKKETTMIMQTSMNRNQDIKKVEKEDRKTEKGSTKENGNYTNRRRTPYYQEQGRYNPPREWRENQGYNRGSWQRPREQRNYGLGNIRCFNCWEWGHYASNCYQTQKRYTNQNQRERGNERQNG